MNDDDDLHGWQLVVLLVFFCSVAGLLLLIAWAARPNWLWDGPLFAFAVAGGACYPARWLVEKRRWWKRLAERTDERRDRAMARALAEAREAAARRRSGHRGRRRRIHVGTVLLNLVGVVLVLASLALIPVGIITGRNDQHVAETAPVQQVKVLSVTVDKWSKNHDVTIEVAHPADGRPVEIYGGDQLDPLPSVGDQIGVYVDRDDPTNVLAADADWVMHWYWYPIIVVIGLVLACFSSMLIA